MLLKQFSHILENTKLTTSKFINDQYSSQNKVIQVSDVYSTADGRYINSVGALVNDAIDNGSSEEQDQNTNTNTDYNGHLMLSFDQTQMQTHIMSKYLQILCDKYGVKESDISFDISPTYKNNKLWLLYTFKFPKLQSSDSISINEFKEYVDQDDEYHIIGTVRSTAGSKIKVFISKSNEISTGPEMDAAIRTGAYTTWSSEFLSGDKFDISVKYGCSVLFRAEYCNDVILLSVHNNIKTNITLEYNNSLENASNNVRIETDPILNNTTSYVYADPEQTENKYTYEHPDPQNVNVIITSMDKNTFHLYSIDKLELVLLEATAGEEYNIADTDKKEWEEVKSFSPSAIIKNNKNQYVLNSIFLTTKLNSISPKSTAFKYYKNTTANNTLLNDYTTSLYLKPALKYKNDNGETVYSTGNIIALDYIWKNKNAAGALDVTSLTGSGNRLVICVKNTPKDGLLRVEAPSEMSFAYIYNGENNKTVPNFIIPVVSNKTNYMSSDIWIAYNGYCNDTFNTRSAYCYNGDIHKAGNMSSTVSFVIEYISYYIDKENPTYFYEQTLYLEGTDPEIQRNAGSYKTDNDIYDIKHKKLVVSGININGLTKINVISEINKKYYKKNDNGELIIKDENGNYTDEGIINNYSDNIGTVIRGTMLYDSENNFKINVNSSLLTSDYVIYLEDKNNNIIVDTATNTGFITNGYLSTPADKFHLIKKIAASTLNINNVAIQNIFPKEVHHIGIYTADSNKMKMAQISFDGESNFTDNSDDAPLTRLGFLSDIHFDESTLHENESSEDLLNAYTYFVKHDVQDIYCAGDLSVRDWKGVDSGIDLEYFHNYLNNNLLKVPEIENANTHLYVSRGNHDIGCIYKMYDELEIQDSSLLDDPNNPIDIPVNGQDVFDEYDKEFLYVVDANWKSYLQDNVTWQNTYFDTGIIDSDNNTVNDYNASIAYDEDVAKSTCGYNEYTFGEEGNEFKLVIIALPLYSNTFWDWYNDNTSTPAYENEELYRFENLLMQKHAQSNTQIIVITHLPFDDIYTGNYKAVYGGMNNWYSSEQYRLLKKIHDSYEGVIWMHGHTHFKYELQGENMTINSYTPESEGYFDNANVSCVNNVFDIHISSGAYPRTPNADGTRSDHRKESQGLLMEVYRDHLIIKGIAFKTQVSENEFLYNKTVPVAMYRINFITNKKLVTNQIIEYDSETNTITEYSPGEIIDGGDNGN